MPRSTRPPTTRSINSWLTAIKKELSLGDNLVAYDLATKANDEYPDIVALEHATVLALARSGATEAAQRLLEKLGLVDKAERAAAPALAEDVAALSARLAKDQALDATGAKRQELARAAAEAYEATYERFGRYYSCINAATMWLIAGDREKALQLARDAQAASAEADKVPRKKDGYWIAATQAEAALLHQDLTGAATALKRASKRARSNYSAVGITRKQLQLICDALGLDAGILAPLKVPGIVHYCGHMIVPPGAQGRFLAEDEAHVAEGIESYLNENDVHFGFGSLACGADILFAEALLRRGAELNVVLPFAADEFKSVSVLRGGASWGDRFDRCLEQANMIVQATEDEYLDDDALFPFCSHIAMGLARLRALALAGEARQVAVWDRDPGNMRAGTGADVAYWESRGGETSVIEPPARDKDRPTGVPAWHSDRTVKAILYGNFSNFSQIPEGMWPKFYAQVMDGLAQVLDDCGADVEHRSSWGDGVHVIFGSVLSAADCALQLQRRIADVDPESFGLSDPSGLRIACHVGPVFAAGDPIRGQSTFYGRHVTRTARLEPSTPPGRVYVTEAFAALLTMEAGDRFECEFIGQLKSAKDYGSFRMYGLKERP